MEYTDLVASSVYLIKPKGIFARYVGLNQTCADYTEDHGVYFNFNSIKNGYKFYYTQNQVRDFVEPYVETVRQTIQDLLE